MSFTEACDSPDFKKWLVVTLEPLCDADPDVLADYIIALLKHDSNQDEAGWKKFMMTELEEFLGAQSEPFVNACFEVIQSKAYLPGAAAAAEAPAAAEAGPSRDAEMTDVSGAPASNGQLPPTPQQPQGPGPHQQGQQGRRPRCRDYHEKGYCMRGAACQYEHSADVIIPTPEMMFAQMAPMMGMPPGQFDFPGGPHAGPGGRGRGGRGGRGRGGRGMPPMPFFPGPGMHAAMPPPDFMGTSRPPSDRNGTTLLISDIPPQHLSMGALTEYFGQFGDVTNVAIEGKSRRALVSFATNREAYQAWKSDEAVFGNRHVKVLWHRPRAGHGEAGQKMLEQSAKLIENMKRLEQGGNPQGDVVAKLEGPESRLRKTLVELEAKERRSKRETLIAEQKVLFARAASASQEDKVAILGRIKEIAKEMEELNKPSPPPEAPSAKDKLDAELAEHGMETGPSDKDELLKLNAQLAALREKASTMGIPATRYSPYGRGSPRGRARGRGRGRGGFARPMRLDNRSSTVKITGDALSNEASQQAIKEWYESTGGSLAPADSGVLVTYPSREMAEKALALGTKDIPNLSAPINVQWHAAPSNGHGAPAGEGDGEVEMGGEGEDGEVHEQRDRDL